MVGGGGKGGWTREKGRGWAFKGIHMANISRTLKSIALTAWHCLKNEPKESSQERKVDRIRDTSAGAWGKGFSEGTGGGRASVCVPIAFI